MNSTVSRRSFLKHSTLAATAVTALGAGRVLSAADSPGDRIVLGVMGTNGRGSDLARGFAALSGVEIAYVCDVDERAIAKGTKAVGDKQSRTPKGVKDFRRILDDKNVDALVVAAPDHWHGPATILACAAGKIGRAHD